MYSLVGLTGLVVAVAIWYAMSSGTGIARKYHPLADAIMEVKFEATIAHLWLEEILSGDRSEDTCDVWHHLDRAEWYAQVMLDGGENDHLTFLPLDDPQLRDDIAEVVVELKAFRTIAEERLAGFNESAAGSDLDQRFDSAFAGFLDQADAAELNFHELVVKETQRFEYVQASLLVLCILLTVIVGVVLHRFLRRQSTDLATLTASNQQVQAAEQQLRASNQQLRASEQQLRASNQQLRASEQQLRASLQQTMAGEQQLRASLQQLRQSRQKLALHVKNTPLGVIEWSTGFEVTEWNKGAEDIFGYTRDEAMGRHGAGLILPESARPITDKVWADLLTQQGGARSTNENITESGEIRICDWYNTPLIDDNGETIGVASLVMDITDRQRVAEDLAQSEARYRSTVDNLLVGVVVHDRNSRVLLNNAKASEILGLTAEQMSGMVAMDPTWRFVYEDTSEMKVEDYPVSRVITTGRPLIGYVLGIIRPDRDKITWVDVSATPMLSNSGELDKVIVNFMDITEMKRLQALESRAARLETAGTIAGQVAHDFNNLLAPIMAYPEFIHDELSHDNKAHAYLDAIESAAAKIASINQDLLTMGRRGFYNQETLDLNRIVLQATQEMEVRAEAVGMQLELGENLMKIKGGGAQIHRILTNLLVNAHDAMGDVGRVTIRSENYYVDDTSIAFGRVPKGEYVKLTVSDDGCGIPENIIQKILDPFFSTKTADKKTGSGLGLSVVDAVMKDHDGYIDMASKVGQGTSFYLYFPITREASEAEELSHAIDGTETILVIDDDATQRDVSSKLLTKLGYCVSSCESGEAAIDFLRDKPQDLLVLDMVMPGGMDGADTYRQIIDFSPHQRAIILSGFSESDRVLEAQKLGAGAFVRKPITRNSIGAAVRTELDRPVEAFEA